MDPAGTDIPGMFPHPPAGFKKSWSRLIIAGSVSGKGSLAGRERAALGIDLGLVTFEFSLISWGCPEQGQELDS